MDPWYFPYLVSDTPKFVQNSAMYTGLYLSVYTSFHATSIKVPYCKFHLFVFLYKKNWQAIHIIHTVKCLKDICIREQFTLK